MSVTILEALWNADYNLNNPVMGQASIEIAIEQLKNAKTLLEKGYSINDEVDPLLEKYGDVESVPQKEEAIVD